MKINRKIESLDVRRVQSEEKADSQMTNATKSVNVCLDPLAREHTDCGRRYIRQSIASHESGQLGPTGSTACLLSVSDPDDRGDDDNESVRAVEVVSEPERG